MDRDGYPASKVRKFLKFSLLIIVIILIVTIFFFSKFKKQYVATINGEFIGYYNSPSDYFTMVENEKKSIYVDERVDGVKITDANFQEIFIKKKALGYEDNDLLIREHLQISYKVYSINVNGEKQFYVSTKEEANKIKKELISETKDGTKIAIKKETIDDISVVKSDKQVDKLKESIIKNNKRPLVTSRSGTRSGSTSTISGNVNSWITNGGWLTSYYRTANRPDHTGIDIGVNTGSNVYAYKKGTVILASWNGGYGYQVQIDHGNGLVTTYAHNSKLLVKKGDKVSKGQVIAKSGSTGRSTGPHIHFEVLVNNNFVNPINYL